MSDKSQDGMQLMKRKKKMKRKKREIEEKRLDGKDHRRRNLFLFLSSLPSISFSFSKKRMMKKERKEESIKREATDDGMETKNIMSLYGWHHYDNHNIF